MARLLGGGLGVGLRGLSGGLGGLGGLGGGLGGLGGIGGGLGGYSSYGVPLNTGIGQQIRYQEISSVPVVPLVQQRYPGMSGHCVNCQPGFNTGIC